MQTEASQSSEQVVASAASQPQDTALSTEPKRKQRFNAKAVEYLVHNRDVKRVTASRKESSGMPAKRAKIAAELNVEVSQVTNWFNLNRVSALVPSVTPDQSAEPNGDTALSSVGLETQSQEAPAVNASVTRDDLRTHMWEAPITNSFLLFKRAKWNTAEATVDTAGMDRNVRFTAINSELSRLWKSCDQEERELFALRAKEASENPSENFSALDEEEKMALGLSIMKKWEREGTILEALGFSVMKVGIHATKGFAFKKTSGTIAVIVDNHFADKQMEICSKFEFHQQLKQSHPNLASQLESARSVRQTHYETKMLALLNQALEEKGLKMYFSFPWHDVMHQKARKHACYQKYSAENFEVVWAALHGHKIKFSIGGRLDNSGDAGTSDGLWQSEEDVCMQADQSHNSDKNVLA
ncbi:hypothetical protein BJ741DRAFT_632646 [Chytriomyces cf. hyalinus JEL632]|nr:hypothetical protein BJ741DRAFT_632646 [Chytriomyces cf. hyalinus JEL632]